MASTYQYSDIIYPNETIGDRYLTMRLAAGVEWALHCCAVLGGLDEGESIAAADLAALYDLPPSYFAKSLQALSAAGIVESSRGKAGGYSLARPAAAVTMLDVVDAIDGVDNVEHGHGRGRSGQRIPAGLAAGGLHDPRRRQRLQRLGEVRRGQVVERGEVGGRDRLTLVQAAQHGAAMERPLDTGGEPHREIPVTDRFIRINYI